MIKKIKKPSQGRPKMSSQATRVNKPNVESVKNKIEKKVVERLPEDINIEDIIL